MTTRLRAVKPDEKSDPKSLSVMEAAASGDRRKLLLSLRATTAKALDDPKTHPRDISPLSRRLQEIASEIEAMDADQDSDDIGQAAATPDEEWASS